MKQELKDTAWLSRKPLRPLELDTTQIKGYEEVAKLYAQPCPNCRINWYTTKTDGALEYEVELTKCEKCMNTETLQPEDYVKLTCHSCFNSIYVRKDMKIDFNERPIVCRCYWIDRIPGESDRW